MSLFIKNAARITSTKGAFDDISRFKVNKIPLYSLVNKSEELVGQKLGAVIKTHEGPSGTLRNLVKFYETDLAFYEVSYEDGKADEIVLKPKLKIKYSGKLFIVDGYRFELIGSNAGEFIAEQNNSSGDTTTDNITYTFRDRSSIRIEFTKPSKDGVQGRFLEEVSAENY